MSSASEVPTIWHFAYYIIIDDDDVWPPCVMLAIFTAYLKS